MTSSSSLTARAGDYRHIVFADELRGPRRAMNFSPRPPDPACRAPCPLSAAQARFVKWLFARAGLDARDYRNETLARRFPACLRALRCASAEEARSRIESNPRLVSVAVDAVLIGVTGFFRDAAVFEALRELVLPAVLDASDGAPRVWSAGCSDGAALWAVASLRAELGALDGAHLLGTDCRRAAVRDASAGAYDEPSLRGVPRDLLHAYFIRAGGGADGAARWHVVPRLRARARWRAADVLSDDEPGGWDLVLCRNLAMYLRPDAAAALWQRLFRALRPGGFLVLGKAERPEIGAASLRAVAPCVYRRDPNR